MPSNSTTRRYFHASQARLSAGTVLRPLVELDRDAQENSVWGVDFYRAHHAWRARRVWMFAAAADAGAYLGFWHGGSASGDAGGDSFPTTVYEVEPAPDVQSLITNPAAEDSLDYGMPPQFHASSAVILRIVPPPR